jgi:pimeloyl-ACP methyl ester carboxylesterase
MFVVNIRSLGSYVSYNYMNLALPMVASDCEVIGIMDSGHYMFEEKPEKVVNAVLAFLLK